MDHIVVGMSGGVDSSVAAFILKQQGFDVVGIFMKNWEETDENGVCTATADYADVRSVCETIGIPYYTVNFANEYRNRVFSYFLDEYRKGRTPNPDVLCNCEIKFKAFLDFSLSTGAGLLATGHYCRLNEDKLLMRGADPGKDQSYFRAGLKRSQLARVVFPIGDLMKSEVRLIAKEQGFTNALKKDSTGVCFIGERNFKQFLMQYLPAQRGDIVDERGRKIGTHDGLMYYTLGQRRGLGIGGRGDGRSWFVIGKDLKKNRLLVAQGEDHPLLYSTRSIAEDVTWVGEAPIREGETMTCMAHYRYRQPDQPVEATLRNGKLLLHSLTPQRAVTPGQSAVLYSGDVCLGGGIITEILDAGTI